MLRARTDISVCCRVALVLKAVSWLRKDRSYCARDLFGPLVLAALEPFEPIYDMLFLNKSL